jgi:hypothetical protein
MTLLAEIPDGATILVDSSPIIYVLEGHAFASKFEPLFMEFEAGRSTR